MLLSERWKKKVQDYELKIQMLKLRNEVKKLEHKLLKLCKEHEEDKRAAREQPLSFYSYHSLDHGSSNIVESSPIYESYGMKCEVIFNHSHPEQEIDYERSLEGKSSEFSRGASAQSCPDLFHQMQLNLETFELIGEPIFDSYEQEFELNEAEPPVYDEHLHYIDEFNFLCLPPSDLCDEQEARAVPNGFDQTNSQLNFAKHEPPLFWESFFAPNSNKSASNGSNQSRENSFKNCYTFKKKGMHSVLHDMLAPGIQARALLFFDSYDGRLLNRHIGVVKLKGKGLTQSKCGPST